MAEKLKFAFAVVLITMASPFIVVGMITEAVIRGFQAGRMMIDDLVDWL